MSSNILQTIDAVIDDCTLISRKEFFALIGLTKPLYQLSLLRAGNGPDSISNTVVGQLQAGINAYHDLIVDMQAGELADGHKSYFAKIPMRNMGPEEIEAQRAKLDALDREITTYLEDHAGDQETGKSPSLLSGNLGLLSSVAESKLLAPDSDTPLACDPSGFTPIESERISSVPFSDSIRPEMISAALADLAAPMPKDPNMSYERPIPVTHNDSVHEFLATTRDELINADRGKPGRVRYTQ